MKSVMNNLSNIRLIVADMDGTLLNDEKHLDSGIKDVIEELNARDIQFTLASGRNIHIMKSYMKELNLNLPCITNNGANIFQNDICMYEQNMMLTELAYAFTILQKQDIPFIAYSNEAVYTNEVASETEKFLHRLRGKTKIIVEHNHDSILRNSIFKVVFINDDVDTMLDLMNDINSHCENLHCVRSENEIYTITHIDATKGKTLKKVLTMLCLQPEQVLVFGDNFNDISMFEVAGISVAMKNSQEEVKQKADFIALSNNENGVSEFIKEHLL